MSKNLFIGNLPFTIEEEELKELFEEFGPLESVTVIKDRETNRSRGFGFVKYQEASDGENAIKSMDSKLVKNRCLKVNAAHNKNRESRKEEPSRSQAW